MERDGIECGLICVLSCVEPCQTYALRRDAEKKHQLLVPALRKCLSLYFYFMDREFGLMHVRLQTWLQLPHYQQGTTSYDDSPKNCEKQAFTGL